MKRLRPIGDDPRYGDRRRSDRRQLAKHQDRRSGRDRRQTWPGSGRSFRKRNKEAGRVRIDMLTVTAVWLAALSYIGYDVATSELRTIIFGGMLAFLTLAIFWLGWRRHWQRERDRERRDFRAHVQREYENREIHTNRTYEQ